MALFRLKKDTEEKKSSKDVDVSAVKKTKEVKVEKSIKKHDAKETSSKILSLHYRRDITSVLRHPRVTEKATLQAEKGVYVFDVSPRATKKDVREAIINLYKVTPRKINMVRIPSKRTRIRGAQNKFGVKSGGKKAYVFVKKGDTIDIV